jgi:hypothetical protein
MDPDATYERWLQAVADGDNEEARYAHSDLMEWLNRGGFEPRWTSSEREQFVDWNYPREYGSRENPTSDAEHLRNTALVVGGLAVVAGIIGYFVWKSESDAVSVYNGTVLGSGGSSTPIGPSASSSSSPSYSTTLVNTSSGSLGEQENPIGINVGNMNPNFPTVPFLPSRG